MVEVRSVNGRFLKCVTRLPDELHGLEPAVETAVGALLGRGTVTVAVRFSDESDSAAATINVNALQRYLDQLEPLASDHGLSIDMTALAALPGVLTAGDDSDRIEQSRAIVSGLVTEACTSLDEMRSREGAAMVEEIADHLDVISARLEQIAQRAPGVVDAYQQRLRQRMESLLAEVGAEVGQDDLLREVAVFAERSDITEEIVRLGAHVAQFRELLGEDGMIGRTLDFLSQEMLREANTIGSKCLDVEVGRWIVEVKGAVDRVKEQVQNLE